VCESASARRGDSERRTPCEIRNAKPAPRMTEHENRCNYFGRDGQNMFKRVSFPLNLLFLLIWGVSFTNRMCSESDDECHCHREVNKYRSGLDESRTSAPSSLASFTMSCVPVRSGLPRRRSYQPMPIRKMCTARRMAGHTTSMDMGS
jgi:hypothetical protein